MVQDTYASPSPYDLDQVDARPQAGVACKACRRGAQAREPAGVEAVSRSKAGTLATGLDLDAHELRVRPEHEVDLRPVRLQPAREEAPAVTPQRPLGQALARQTELGRRRVAESQEGSRYEEGQEASKRS